MFESAQIQYTTSRYASQLAEQLKRIEMFVESGRDLTIRLVDSDRESTLVFKGGKAFEASESTAVAPGQKRPTLADNDGIVPFMEGRVAFDMEQAERELGPSSTAHRRAGTSSPPMVDDAQVRARLAAGLPLTQISQLGGDEYFLVSDCTYCANDGYTITALKDFKTDLASIPKLLMPFVAPRELSITAPTFHDLIYRSAGRVAPPAGTVSPTDKVFSRREADDLFLELMTREKIGFFKRNFAYGAVRLAGRRAWPGD